MIKQEDNNYTFTEKLKLKKKLDGSHISIKKVGISVLVQSLTSLVNLREIISSFWALFPSIK